LKSNDFAVIINRLKVDDAAAAKNAILQLRQERRDRRRVLSERLARWMPPLYKKAHIRQLNANLRQRLLTMPKEQGLLLWGASGVGKTHTAMALIRWHITQRNAVQRFTYTELLLKLRACFNGGGNEQAVIKSLMDVPVLFIDDLAAGSLSDYSTMAVLNIIDGRIEQCRPTIITSNLSPESIEQVFGERLGSRLKTFLALKISGQDKRK